MIYLEPRLLCDRAIISIDKEKKVVIYEYETLINTLIDDYMHSDPLIDWEDAIDVSKEYVCALMIKYKNEKNKEWSIRIEHNER
tara:strand:+ start:28710 stop:28961 length:252 start_codon:yes stop_codon:yes gene_type:complete